MVNQNKIFSFKIKHQAKTVFPSDVEKTVAAPSTIFGKWDNCCDFCLHYSTPSPFWKGVNTKRREGELILSFSEYTPLQTGSKIILRVTSPESFNLFNYYDKHAWAKRWCRMRSNHLSCYCLFDFRSQGPVIPLGSYWVWSVNLLKLFLGRLSPLSG